MTGKARSFSYNEARMAIDTTSSEAQYRDNNDNKPNQKQRNRQRWVWLRITLAALLWFTPNIYIQKSLEYANIDLQSGSLNQSEYDTIVSSNRKYFLACKLGSSVLLLGSILYLIGQIGARRPQPYNSNKLEN